MDLLTKSKNIDWHRVVELCIDIEDFSLHANSGDRCKIILVEKDINMLKINNSEYKLIPPSIICLNHADRLDLSGLKTENISCLYFHPRIINDIFEYEAIKNIVYESLTSSAKQDAVLLNSFYQINEPFPKIFSITPKKHLQLRELFINIKYELSEQYDGYWPCRSRSYLIELLFLIMQLNFPSEADSFSSSDDTQANEIIDYLSEHISDKISLSELSKKYLLNRNKLNEIMKIKTGMTAIQYLSYLRIQIASYLLSDTELTVTEIAGRIGYNNTNDFSSYFKKNTGLSPRNFRAKMLCDKKTS